MFHEFGLKYSSIFLFAIFLRCIFRARNLTDIEDNWIIYVKVIPWLSTLFFFFFNNATWFYIVHASRPVGFIHSTGRVDGMVDCTIPPTPPLPPPFLVHLFVLVSMVIIVILDVLTNNHWFPSRTDLNATGFLRERSCRCTHLMKNISWQ